MKYTLRIFLLSVSLVGLGFSGAAQKNYKKVDEKRYGIADILFKLEDYQTALDTYEELYHLDSLYEDVNFKIGACMFHIPGQRKQAKNWLEIAKNLGSTEAYYYLAKIYHLEYQFDNAIKHYRYYKVKENKRVANSIVDWEIEIVQRAYDAQLDPVEVEITNLGPGINSAGQDYVPLVTADGNTLFFTSRREGGVGNLKDPKDEFFEDVYVSTKNGGKWSEASNVGPPINSATHDATVGISANGNALLIYRTNENLSGGDLYMSELGSIDNWMAPKKLGPRVNSKYQEASASLASDEAVMYFSSNRPGGYGGKDLYMVKRLPIGEWGLPKNMGPNINSEHDEDAPFISSDGKTLYFSSNGHSTIGGYDIFRVEYDENNQWTFPENLGYPLNTVEDDIYFSLSADGRTGYYSSEKVGGYGRQDIYQVEMLFDYSKPTIVHGVVKDDSGKPIKARITLMNEDNKTLHGIYNSNASTGKYLLIVKPEISYKVVVEAEGYLSYVSTVEYTVENEFEEKQESIKLTKELEDEW